MNRPPDLYSPRPLVLPTLNVYGPAGQLLFGPVSKKLTFDSDFPGLATVYVHSLDLRECNKVSILQSVPCLIQTSDHSLLTLASSATTLSCVDDLTHLLDVDDHTILGLLACWIDTCKVLSEIVEYRSAISACLPRAEMS